MTEQQTVKKIDVTGEICPWPVIFTTKELKKMHSGEILEVITDHMPSTLNVPAAAVKEGHTVLGTERIDDGVYKISIKIK